MKNQRTPITKERYEQIKEFIKKNNRLKARKKFHHGVYVIDRIYKSNNYEHFKRLTPNGRHNTGQLIGFARNPELASIAGKKGGLKSKRRVNTPTKKPATKPKAPEIKVEHHTINVSIRIRRRLAFRSPFYIKRTPEVEID